MFIAHGEWVRKNLRWVLAGVLILLIPGFIAMFTTTGSKERQTTGDLPTIQGKPVNAMELERAKAAVRARYLVRTGREIPRSVAVEDEVTQEAVLRIAQLRKAAELGIKASNDELVRQMHTQPMFLSEKGQFDPERYRQTMVFYNSRGIDEGMFEAVMHDEFIIGRLQSLVTSAAKVTPRQVALAYEPLHEKVAIDLVKFDVADYHDPVEVTEAEAKTYYEKNKETFRQPVQAKVRYAHFTISGVKPSVKLTDADIAEYYERNKIKYTGTNNVAVALDSVKDEIRAELLAVRAERMAGDRATEMSVKLVQTEGGTTPDFAKLAGEFGAEMKETDYFGPRDSVSGVDAGQQFNQVVFALTTDAPFSDPVTGKDGFYVLQLLDRKPSRIPPFDEVKEKVVVRLKQERTYEATVKRGQDAAAKIKQAVVKGKSFADACAELSLKFTSPAPFTLVDETPTLPAATNVKQQSLAMTTNAVSDFVPTATGGVFFYLKERAAPDPALFEKDKEQFAARTLAQNRQAIYESWLQSLVRDEQITFGRLRSREKPAEASSEEETDSEPAPAPAPSQS